MREKRDVLILCQYFYPEYVSSSTLPTEMAEDLVDKGIGVNVLCSYPKEYVTKNHSKILENEVYKGINIKRVRHIQVKRNNIIGRLINQLSFFVSVIFKIGYIINHKMIIVYSDPPMLPYIVAMLNKIFNIQYMFVVYDIFPDIAIATNVISNKNIMAKVMNRINKKVYAGASKVIALSEEMKAYILKSKLTENEYKIEVIPNWYDKNKIKFNKIKNNEIKKLKENNEFIVLYSGNMGTCQDMDTIIKAAIRLRYEEKIIFVFTGHGNKKPAIKKLIDKYKLNNVKLYDFLLGDDYCDMLMSADCNIVSLEKGIEGLGVPSKTYSYLASGKSLIALMSKETDIAKNLKEYKAGFTIEQGDVKELSNTIIMLKNNKNYNKRLGENARILFEELYERKICTEKYYDVIKKHI